MTPKNDWTSVVDLHAQVQKLWDNGQLLKQLLVQIMVQPVVTDAAFFPFKLRLRTPSSADLAERSDEVRAWIASFRAPVAAPAAWRVVWRAVRHRVVGDNQLPEAVWLDNLDDALAVIGKQQAAAQFVAIVASTIDSHPAPRFGFRDKPLRIRFRLLDPKLALLGGTMDQDLTVTQAAFATLSLHQSTCNPLQRVFITENEVNFLAFPSAPASMVVFGAGYGFDALSGADWLHQCAVHYWGDIDTHGFAILDQLRTHLPHAQSMLMDEATLLAHREHWGHEAQPTARDLPRLNVPERQIFDGLRNNRWRPQLRLEQERVGFAVVERAVGLLQ